MKEKRELTWEERHPNGDVSHHTFIDGFDGLITLNEEETKVALRVLKAQLQEVLGFDMSDSLFVDIFRRIPYLAPSRPYGAFSTLHGFILPLRDTLKSHNAIDNNWRKNVSTIMKFFGVGGSGFSLQSSDDMNLDL